MTGKVKRAAALGGNHGAGQAAAQLVVWLLELMFGAGTVPPEIAVAIGVLIGELGGRLQWSRLFARKGKQMKMFSVFVCVGLVGVLLSGCGTLGARAADKVAPVVNEYCEREPYSARLVYRNTINGELDGHTVEVHCAGDPEEGG